MQSHAQPSLAKHVSICSHTAVSISRVTNVLHVQNVRQRAAVSFVLSSEVWSLEALDLVLMHVFDRLTLLYGRMEMSDLFSTPHPIYMQGMLVLLASCEHCLSAISKTQVLNVQITCYT